MPGTTTLAQLRAAPAQLIRFLKAYEASIKGGQAAAANLAHSYWETAELEYTTNPGAAPGEAVDKSHPACPPYVPASGANALYVRDYEVGIDTYQGGFILLVDRLVNCSGLVYNTTDAQTVNLAALTRYTSGAWVWPLLAVYTEVATGAITLTVTYTDQDGNTGASTTVGNPAAANTANRDLIPIPLASGDYGCRTVESVAVGTAQASAGNFGFVLVRPLLLIARNLAAPGHSALVGLGGGLRKIEAGACLELLAFDSGSFLPGAALTLNAAEL